MSQHDLAIHAGALERVIESLTAIYNRGGCEDSYLATRLNALYAEWWSTVQKLS